MKKGDRPLRFHIIVSGTGPEHLRSHETEMTSSFLVRCAITDCQLQVCVDLK